MLIQRIAEHYVDLDALPIKAKVLDLGARGFHFTNEMRRLGYFVIPVDMDELGREDQYFHCAISDYDGICGMTNTGDPQGVKINKFGTGIECYTLKSFSDLVGVEFWDAIKIDVEGSEYQIIMSLEAAPAKQLSIEFHLHTGAYGHHEVDMMLDKLKSLGYQTLCHELTNEHGAGMNYWSSLFILK